MTIHGLMHGVKSIFVPENEHLTLYAFFLTYRKTNLTFAHEKFRITAQYDIKVNWKDEDPTFCD